MKRLTLTLKLTLTLTLTLTGRQQCRCCRWQMLYLAFHLDVTVWYWWSSVLIVGYVVIIFNLNDRMDFYLIAHVTLLFRSLRFQRWLQFRLEVKFDFGVFGACLLCLDRLMIILLLPFSNLCCCLLLLLSQICFNRRRKLGSEASSFQFGFVPPDRTSKTNKWIAECYPHRVGLVSVLYVYYSTTSYSENNYSNYSI